MISALIQKMLRYPRIQVNLASLSVIVQKSFSRLKLEDLKSVEDRVKVKLSEKSKVHKVDGEVAQNFLFQTFRVNSILKNKDKCVHANQAAPAASRMYLQRIRSRYESKKAVNYLLPVPKPESAPASPSQSPRPDLGINVDRDTDDDRGKRRTRLKEVDASSDSDEGESARKNSSRSTTPKTAPGASR